MAFGMKHWLGLAVVGCALVAIELLPPRAVEYGGHPAPTASMRRVQRLGAEVRRTAGLYQRMRWADSLSTLLVADARNGVAVGGPPGLAESTLVHVREWVTAQRERGGPVDSDVQFGFYVQPSNQSAVYDGRMMRFPGLLPETMAGTADGKPYCATVAVVDAGWLTSQPHSQARLLPSYWRGIPTGNLLGACRPFVRFGLPGPRIAEWLKRGGIALAQAAAEAEPRDRILAYIGTQRDQPWLLRWSMPGANLPLDACLAGRPAACLQLALYGRPESPMPGESSADAIDRFIVARTPFYRVQDAYAGSAFGYSGRYVLADLERQFGAAAFRRFWTSDEPVPRAFRDAFGMDMGAWLVGWTKANLYTYRAGPSLPRSAAFGGFALLVLCGVIAGAWATKRSVA